MLAAAAGLNDSAEACPTYTYVRACASSVLTEGKVEILGGGYLSLGSPQHVLLFLKDGIHTLKELHALLGNPAKKRELIDNSSLKIEMKGLGKYVNLQEKK